jgi:hypothetical protein
MKLSNCLRHPDARKLRAFWAAFFARSDAGTQLVRE